MEELEEQTIEIQAVMYDTVTPNFDRVSGLNNNDTIPLQGQQDKQSETVNTDKEAIDSDENEILADYPQWSSETHDKYDSAEDIYDRNRKEIQGQINTDPQVKQKKISPMMILLILTIEIELR